MFNLPPELALDVLSNLPLTSLANVLLVCKDWKQFVEANESAIFHNACVYHGYIKSPAVTIDQARGMYSERSVGLFSGWKELCPSTFFFAVCFRIVDSINA
jgi:hypothetical protein